MRFIAYYNIVIGLVFYSSGLLLLCKGACFYEKLIDADIIILILWVVVTLISIMLGVVKLGVGIRDLSK